MHFTKVLRNLRYYVFVTKDTHVLKCTYTDIIPYDSYPIMQLVNVAGDKLQPTMIKLFPKNATDKIRIFNFTSPNNTRTQIDENITRIYGNS
jgi:hypothetical protein